MWRVSIYLCVQVIHSNLYFYPNLDEILDIWSLLQEEKSLGEFWINPTLMKVSKKNRRFVLNIGNQLLFLYEIQSSGFWLVCTAMNFIKFVIRFRINACSTWKVQSVEERFPWEHQKWSSKVLGQCLEGSISLPGGKHVEPSRLRRSLITNLVACAFFRPFYLS